jgi:glycosyltransferase involved in cell wall biosynthesis
MNSQLTIDEGVERALRRARIAVAIPCYRTKAQVMQVIAAIGPEVSHILAVDDACPENTGKAIAEACQDSRVQVVYLKNNQGVGGATLAGWRLAAELDVDVLVKLDSDGQMDPKRIRRLVLAICAGKADFCKGNRFFARRGLKGMPWVRLLGNAGLSLLNKLSSGYWQIMDPNNGFLAIHARVFRQLDHERIARRYFFESDLLHHLGLLRARVLDVPIPAIYAGEPSSLSPMRQLWPFFRGHARNTFRRLLHSYLLRGVSLASLELLIGIPLLLFGLAFGASAWWESQQSGVLASAGTVMLAALPIMMGMQMLMSWLNFDVQQEPRDCIWPMLIDHLEDGEQRD